MQRTIVLAAATLVATALGPQSSLFAQSNPGYRTTTDPLPNNAASSTPLGGGSIIYYDDFDVVVNDGQGSITPILALPGVFSSFFVRIDAQRVLFGESSNGGVYVLDLNGPNAATPITNLTFNYDATLWQPDTAIISAKTGGFAVPDNDLIAVDLVTGTTTNIASVPGASGAVIKAPDGSLVYATASALFPAPAGTVSVLRWTSAAVNSAIGGGPLLTDQNAQTLFAGLDAAGDIVIDEDGDLILTDWFNNQIIEVNDVFGSNPTVSVLRSYQGAFVSPGGLHYVADAGSTPGFEPFQPGSGKQLVISETNFVSVNQLSAITPEPATLSVPQTVPPGQFSVDLVGGPANGTAIVAFSLFAPSPLPTPPTFFGGFEQGLFWDLASLNAFATELVSLDGNGGGSAPQINPSLGGLGITAQYAFVDADGRVIGATTAVPFTLQ